MIVIDASRVINYDHNRVYSKGTRDYPACKY